MEPLFRYDFNSPYAYLAASRVDTVLPEPPRWQPIAFAFLLTHQQRIPWSFDRQGERAAGVADCEQRAQEYGLPALTWPEGWPQGSYTLEPLRAALYAEEQGALREYSMAAFARNFADGSGLLGDAPLEVAEEIGLDPDATRAAMGGPARQRLKDVTQAAIAAGVHGVPTVTMGDEHFWGDDRLEAAAQAVLAATGSSAPR